MNAPKIIALPLLLFICLKVFSQEIPEVEKLRDYAQQHMPRRYDSSLSYTNLMPGGNLNYLYPLYQLFKQEKKFREIETDNGYYDNICQSFAFVGDYQSALEYQQKKYEEPDAATVRQIKKTVDELKGLQFVDARVYISFLAQNYKVIMLNEAHDKPFHRAFALSLLEDLYKKGFRYLAMEMLSDDIGQQLHMLTSATGYYCNEPVAGELVRRALEIGFKLVPYEDSLGMVHSPMQRDSVQAQNIYKLLQKDPNVKIFVYAGYGHIAKKSLGDGYIPMGLALKKISGIDPLCIDQTDMTDASEMGYGKALYQAYTEKFLINKSSIAMEGTEPVNISNNQNYDLIVIHPTTKYRDGRPSWLDLGSLRQAVYIKPTVPETFLAQAYYEGETKKFGPGQIVPADQTYIKTNKQNFLLYLRKGKYLITFRDITYRLIGKLTIEVN